MEATIKQAEEDRNHALEIAKKLYDEYLPMKNDVDSLRSVIGLDKLPDLQDEEDKLKPELVIQH